MGILVRLIVKFDVIKNNLEKWLNPFEISTKGSEKNILCGTESCKNQKKPSRL